MWKFAVWLFWKLWYAWSREDTTLKAYLVRSTRLRWPWQKFRPSIWHDADNNEWHIYFTNEVSITARRSIEVDCHVECDSGSIIGFTVQDEKLRNQAASLEKTDGES